MKETWKWIPGYEGRYQVSDRGRVRSVDRCIQYTSRVRSGETKVVKCLRKGRLLRPGVASHGYPTVALARGAKTIHSLVTAAFIGPRPEGLVVCHQDGDKTNNRLSNLRYGTWEQNSADSDRHGTRVRGEAYPNAKLCDESAREVRSLKGRIPQSELAVMFGVSPAAIQAVHDGRTWKHV